MINVVIGAGAKVLGAITVGSCSRIGANAVVVNDVPPNSVVVGVPGRVRTRTSPGPVGPDLHHDFLPDAVGNAVRVLSRRIEMMEEKMAAMHHEEYMPSQTIHNLRAQWPDPVAQMDDDCD